MRVRGWLLMLIPIAFGIYALAVLVDGQVESLKQAYALELVERLLMVMMMLTSLSWYDTYKGYDGYKQLPANYLAGRVIAVAIVLAFGGIG